ncbi:copper amine oxidase N-terminal domain-containing protein [Paenibacillus odorifer]|uniref:copper amine oxidase N-terminal domain-containing protein n=1 Tax=Paenibacillus odorifer TaxID=189426 RepID=UPI0009D6B289|nr:copper amine oxidase N-terminal domain-containing protein [Paenibacillus odorifer]
MLSFHSKAWLSVLMLSTLLLPATMSASSSLTVSESSALAQASSASTSQVYYQFGIPGGNIGGPALLKNGVIYVDVRGIAEQAGLKMEWDKSGKRALFKGWTKSFAVRIGSQTGVLDGKAVDLGGIPFKSKEDGIYVPARFIVKVFEGSHLRLDSTTNTLLADDLKTYNVFTESFGGRTYTLVKANGDLYVSQGKDTVIKLTSLQTNFDWAGMKIEKTAGGLLVIKIIDSYGEPHINTREITLIFKNGALLRKATFAYQFRGDADFKPYDGNLILHDGNTLRFIQDGTGNVIDTLDLVKLGGEEDAYYVESIDKEIILLRGNQNGLLTLIDRQTGERTLLYKELLTAKDQEYAENNDVPFKGDTLKFVKRSGDKLYFINDSPLTGKKEVIYSIEAHSNNSKNNTD